MITNNQKILAIIAINSSIKMIKITNMLATINIINLIIINNILIIINTNIYNINNITKKNLKITMIYIKKWKCNRITQMIKIKLCHNITKIKMMLLVIYLKIVTMMISL
jgi:hypothetical protein